MFAIALASCTGGVKEDSQGTAPVDTIRQETDTAKLVTGVAVGGAMNSVSLKVGDDTIEFTYPDLDVNNRDSWDINDTLTVQYVQTESGDSVTSISNSST